MGKLRSIIFALSVLVPAVVASAGFVDLAPSRPGAKSPALVIPSSYRSDGVMTERIASGLSYPLYLTAPVGDSRLFVLEQGGKILIIEDGLVLATPFLDISALTTGAGERGLLGLAFPPDYATSGLFYINYTDLVSDTVIARYQISGNPNIANAASAEIVLNIPQDGLNHNGGQIAFGPDGYLYIGMGDGGGYSNAGDPENAQKDDTLLGKMLRIDVGGGLGSGYTIPLNNPYVGKTPLDEIWAKGFRNPYRWSFDRATGDQYIGDVGQHTWEEVSVEPSADPGGRNYGWPRMEGPACYEPLTGCNDGSLTLPVHAFDHLDGRCSITGGYVYRGTIESIQGHYFFADWCTGEIWTFVWDGANGVTQLQNRTLELTPSTGTIRRVSAIGEDGFGELYFIRRRKSDGEGEVFKLVARSLAFLKTDTP